MSKIAGSISSDTPRAPRRKLTLTVRIAELDQKIFRAEKSLNVLRERRGTMILAAQSAAKAALAEAEKAGA
jgi:hypothetical protein